MSSHFRFILKDLESLDRLHDLNFPLERSHTSGIATLFEYDTTTRTTTSSSAMVPHELPIKFKDVVELPAAKEQEARICIMESLISSYHALHQTGPKDIDESLITHGLLHGLKTDWEARKKGNVQYIHTRHPDQPQKSCNRGRHPLIEKLCKVFEDNVTSQSLNNHETQVAKEVFLSDCHFPRDERPPSHCHYAVHGIIHTDNRIHELIMLCPREDNITGVSNPKTKNFRTDNTSVTLLVLSCPDTGGFKTKEKDFVRLMSARTLGVQQVIRIRDYCN